MRRRTKKSRDNVLAAGGKVSAFYSLSLLFAGLYLFGHINQLQGTIIRPGSGYFNITNLLLCALGVVEVLFPVFLALGKTKYTKLTLYATSALYVVGNLWFIRWLYVIIVSGNVSFDFAAYQLSWYNMFNHTIWASRNAETLLLNYLSAYLWFCVGWNIDRDKQKTCNYMLLIIIVTFILPVIFFAATRFRLISDWWIKKSITLFVCYISIYITMRLAKTRKSYWARFICPLRLDAKKASK